MATFLGCMFAYGTDEDTSLQDTASWDQLDVNLKGLSAWTKHVPRNTRYGVSCQIVIQRTLIQASQLSSRWMARDPLGM